MKQFLQTFVIFIAFGLIGEAFADEPTLPNIIDVTCMPSQDLCSITLSNGDYLQLDGNVLPYLIEFDYDAYEGDCSGQLCYNERGGTTGLNPNFPFFR